MHEPDDDDGTTFIVGFAMGFFGSLAGLAAAVSTSRAYTQPAVLGAAANLCVLTMLLLVELTMPGTLFDFMPVPSRTNPLGPGPLVLMLGVVALVVLVSMVALRMTADTGDPARKGGTIMGITSRDIPALMMGLSLLIVLAVGGWWWFIRAPINPSEVARHEGRGNVGTVQGATFDRAEHAGQAAQPREVTSIRCPTLEKEPLYGRVEELHAQTQYQVATHEITGDEQGAFSFAALGPDGVGSLQAWGFEPARLVWSGGVCQGTLALRPRPGGTFRVTAAALRFVGPLEVTACGGKASALGPEVTIPVYDVDEDCTIEVVQLVNGVRLPSPPVRARGRIGEEIHVSVGAPRLPALAHSDPGWRLVAEDDHLVVEGVYPLSEADRALIAPGDLVTAIQGQPWPTTAGAIVRLPLTATIVRPGGEPRTVRLPVP